jgi:hypothetical protein
VADAVDHDGAGAGDDGRLGEGGAAKFSSLGRGCLNDCHGPGPATLADKNRRNPESLNHRRFNALQHKSEMKVVGAPFGFDGFRHREVNDRFVGSD